MISIKLFNVKHQGRSNQNVTFSIFGYGADMTEEKILKSLKSLKPVDVELQKNTSLKILYRR